MKAFLRVLDVMVGVRFLHLSIVVVAWARGVEGATLLALRWRMRQSRAGLGHRSESSEVLWPIF